MDEQHFGIMIKKIHDSIGKNANNKLRSKNLTFMQVQTLRSIYFSDDKACSLKELEKQLNIAQSTVVGIVSRLEKKDMIVGFADSADNRIKRVKLTSHGVSCCVEAEEDIETTEKMLLANFTDSEKEMLYEMLQRVYKNVI